MAGRDLTQELFGTDPPAGKPQGRDLSNELGLKPLTTQERVIQSAQSMMHWLPGGEVLQAAPVMPQRQPLPAEELAPPLWPETAGTLQTRGALPALGELAGSTVTAGAARPFGAAAGAMTGEALEQFLHGEPFDAHKVVEEGGLSLLPEVAESVGRWGLRQIIRGTEGAKQIRWSEAARRAREELPAVFNPKSRQEVSASFQQLRDSGIPVDVSEFSTVIADLSQGKADELLGEIRRIDRRLKSGGRFREAFEAARAGNDAALDVGDLQTLRSELRKRADAMETAEARQLLRDAQHDIDDVIDDALARYGGQADVPVDLARQARRDYARLRASEEMRDFVEQKITSSPDLTDVQFNLRALADDLRRNRTRSMRQLNRALDFGGQAARRDFDRVVSEISQLYRRIELPLADVSRGRRQWIVAMLGGWLSDIMLSTAGRDLFEQAILQGRGRISPNLLANIASVARREQGVSAFGGERVEGQRDRSLVR